MHNVYFHELFTIFSRIIRDFYELFAIFANYALLCDIVAIFWIFLLNFSCLACCSSKNILGNEQLNLQANDDDAHSTELIHMSMMKPWISYSNALNNQNDLDETIGYEEDIDNALIEEIKTKLHIAQEKLKPAGLPLFLKNLINNICDNRLSMDICLKVFDDCLLYHSLNHLSAMKYHKESKHFWWVVKQSFGRSCFSTCINWLQIYMDFYTSHVYKICKICLWVLQKCANYIY